MFPTMLTVLWRVAFSHATSFIKEAVRDIAQQARNHSFRQDFGMGWKEPVAVAPPKYGWIEMQQENLFLNILRALIWIQSEPYAHCFAFAPIDSTAYHMMQSLNRRIIERSDKKFKLFDADLDLQRMANLALERGSLRAWEVTTPMDLGNIIAIHRLEKPSDYRKKIEGDISSVTLELDHQEFVVYRRNGFRIALFKAVPNSTLLKDCSHLCHLFLDSVADFYMPNMPKG
jgi:hypothetical protein